MMILAALVVLSVAAGVRPADQVTCRQPILCPCGDTGKSVKVCTEEEENPCIRWSNCRSCQDGFDGCLECPEASEGLWCSKGLAKLPRQKRQTFGYNTFYTGPRQTQRQFIRGSCPELNAPKLGSIRCSYTNRQRTCVGNCLPGYRFENHGSESEITLICVGNHYDPLTEFPPCKSEGLCDLIIQGPGNFNCTTAMTGTLCDVTCNNWYMGRYFCFPEQPWEPALPSCVRPKGTFQLLNQEYGERDYVCRMQFCDNTVPPYPPQPSLVNTAVFGWFEPPIHYPPAMRAPATSLPTELSAVITRTVTCPDPGFIENGRRSSYNEVESAPRLYFDVGAKAGYTCVDKTFELQGKHVLTCLSDGKWNNPLPKCVRKAVTPVPTTTTTPAPVIQCSDPGVDPNGHRKSMSFYDDKGFPPGSVLEYSCKNGYDLKGQDKIFCLRTGRWSSGRPTCESQARQTGPQHLVRLCPDPGVDSNGRRSPVEPPDSTGFPAGSILDYSCNNGYNLDGQGKIFCLRSGSWSAERPKCVLPVTTYCRDPGLDLNGGRNLQSPPDPQGFPEGSRLEYFCISGYKIEGVRSIFCLKSGKWSSPRPKCKPESRQADLKRVCMNPSSFSNGRIVYYPPVVSGQTSRPQRVLQGLEYPLDSLLLYSCNSGYILQGSDSLTCEENGKWSSAPPICVLEKTCTTPPSFLNGRIMYYPPVRVGERRRPQTVTQGLEYFIGSLLLYSCNSGHTLQGTDTLTCEDNGEWSSDPPVCINDKTCTTPPSFLNGRIVYYPPVGTGERRRPQTVTQGLEYGIGSLLLYSCNSGHTLQGIDTLTCEENGEWSSDPPVCESENSNSNGGFCPDPGVDPNGYREPRRPSNPQGFPHGSRVEFFCNLGYTLQGDGALFCLSSGDWLSERPTCVPQNIEPVGAYCPNPGDVANGQVVYYPSIDARRRPDAALDETMYPEGARLRYSCNPGYNLDGGEFITCQSNGRWVPRPPICASVSGRTIRYCDELGLISNGKVDYFLPLGQQTTTVINGAGYPQYPVGTRLEYSCDIGYVLDGPSKLTCQESGDWSPEIPPNCITRDPQHILSCLSLGPFLNGKIRQSSRIAEGRTGSSSLVPEDKQDFPEGTTLKYECDEGYTLDGTDTITCMSSGIWTASPPKCIAECGYSMVGATRRILNGNKTKVGEWPWVVAIAAQENNYTRIICGGALLNTRTVITAAHCVTGHSSFVLYFGKYYRSVSKDDKDVQVARSERVIIHPNYNVVTMDSDIALIKFKPRIKYSPRVQPICLPTGATTTVNLDVGQKGFVTGWGENEKQVNSGELMMAYLPYQSNQDCLDSFRENVPNFRLVLTQNMFCAGYPEANQSTCRGDSGSPFVFFDPITERHTIEGLVSFTVEGQCGLSGIYSIYTKVYQYIPWIFRNL